VKQVVIVGGGGGLGTAIVKKLLDDGCKVVVAGRTRPLDQRIRHFYPIDATKIDWLSFYLTIEKATATPIHALIFVAGTAAFGKTALIPLESARQVFELNFWACATAAKAIAQHWEEKAQPGRFVALLSIVARRAVPFEAYYAASKAATARFLECLQLEYAHKNIEFACAFPGMLNTAFRRQSQWYGLTPAPAERGADVQKTAEAIVKLLKSKRRSKVIGWRERSIDLADRFWPGLYDRAVLQNRVKKLLR
jgi:short-subunit dehydrogenase